MQSTAEISKKDIKRSVLVLVARRSMGICKSQFSGSNGDDHRLEGNRGHVCVDKKQLRIGHSLFSMETESHCTSKQQQQQRKIEQPLEENRGKT